MAYGYFQRGQELQVAGNEVLVHVISGVLRIDLVDVRCKSKLFLHLALPGDHFLLVHDATARETHCASALMPVRVQFMQAPQAQFERAMRALPQLMMRRHAETMKLRSAQKVSRKIETLFQILQEQAGISEEELYQGTLLRQVQVASILGVTPESVSRALCAMRPALRLEAAGVSNALVRRA